MISENMVLGLTLLLYFIDFSAILGKRFRLGDYSLMGAGFLSLLTSFWFSYSFVTDRFVLKAVYEQSSKSLSPLLKLSASWTGSGGSLLLWLGMMTVALLVFRLKNRHSMSTQQTGTSFVMSFFTMIIIAFVLVINPFKELPVAVPDGLGQNPSLQSLLSMIHPPLVFAAYTMVLFSYSRVLARRWTAKAHPSQNERILHATWVLLTLAITFGGFWAYQTLGWGGYWVWDPLETSALIPLLSLTALLFAKLMGCGENYDLLATTFSASTLFFTVYIARSATVPSVHGYGTFLGGAFILLLAIVPVFLSLLVARRRPIQQIDANRGKSRFPDVALIFWSVMLIASANLALLLYRALGAEFGVAFGARPQLHNYASFPMLIAFVMVVFVKCVKERPSYKDMFFSFTFLLATGFVLLFLEYPARNVLASLGLPFIVALLGAATYRILRWVSKSPRPFHSYSGARYIAFFGVAILLLGVFISSSMGTSASETVSMGQSFSVPGLKLSVEQVSTLPGDRQIFLPPYGMVPESIDSKIKISYNLDNEPSSTMVLFLKYYPARDQFVPTPSIHSSFFEDAYIVAGATDSVRQATALAFKNRTAGAPTDIGITVKRIPAISLVWFGVAIMVIGNLPFVFVSVPLQGNGGDVQPFRNHRRRESLHSNI